MVTRKQEMTREEYNSLPVYYKNRIEPIFIDSVKEDKIVDAIIDKPVEVKTETKDLYSYEDLERMKTSQQEDILENFGLDKKEIKKLKKEKDRIEKILELQ